jgi:hypothetical protein
VTLDHCAACFGLTWYSDIALDGFSQCLPTADDARSRVQVSRVATLADRGAGRPLNRGRLYADGIRFGWGDEVVFDMIDGARITYLPGPDWRGTLPFAFYSTLSALTLAWRGAIPFHAGMIEVDGQAVMIAGPSGAGKSSLTAGLLGIGAQLVADDLSIVRVEAGRVETGWVEAGDVEAGDVEAGGIRAGRIRAYRGRPTMRQHRDTAARIDADLRQPIPDDPRGKWLVRPRARSSEIDLPLGGMLVLTHRPIAHDAAGKLALLSAQLFRPRWFAALPDLAARRRDLLAIAAAVPVDGFPAITMFDAQDQAARAHHALARIRTMIAARTSP